MISDSLLDFVDQKRRNSLLTILEGDPRPHYKDDPDYIYGMRYADYEIKFKVKDSTLTVVDIIKAI